MDMRRISSYLRSQTMGTKDICILVVHDDPIYHNIIVEILENCSHYEVMKIKKVADALNIIREKIDRLSIVITDVHRSHSNGFEILNYIEKEFKLPVISMTPHQNTRVVSVELGSGAKLYFVKSFSVNEFKILWQHAYTKKRGKATIFQGASMIQKNEKETSLESEGDRDDFPEDRKRKEKEFEETDEQSEGYRDDSPNEKKKRVMWNESMHHKFLRAVHQLGHDRLYPKKILEIMNVPGLTRENVASHLQKYRECLKRSQEINSTPLRYFRSNYSDAFCPETNHIQYLSQNPLFTSYQPNFPFPESSTSTSNIWKQQFLGMSNQESPKTQSDRCPPYITMPSNFPYSTYPETSTGTSNLEQQNFITVNNQESPISPYTHNSPLIATTQIHNRPLIYQNPQPDSSNNCTYVGFRLTGFNGESVKCGQTVTENIKENTGDTANLSNEANGNEILLQLPLSEMDNNREKRFYVPPAECDIEDLLDGTAGTTNSQITFDFDDLFVDQN